jgi:hypothetical protein
MTLVTGPRLIKRACKDWKREIEISTFVATPRVRGMDHDGTNGGRKCTIDHEGMNGKHKCTIDASCVHGIFALCTCYAVLGSIFIVTEALKSPVNARLVLQTI